MPNQSNITLIQTDFDGLLIIKPSSMCDDRGCFDKFFNFDSFEKNNLQTDFKEFYFSNSKKDVIRGMHFQVPPHDHTKIVSVSHGAIQDVVLDIQRNSPTFGRFFSCKLDTKEEKALYIPSGFAHGFLALEDNTIVNYLQTSCYSQTHDAGIRYDSFGMEWAIESPILSERDKSFPAFTNFNTPF
ncbi:MAG: dTDP-4-dehydrorhamnose 3,5-epimerase [Bacteroidales bacterium]|jgi:dTDP-4-dehydrorhamnose 3,5-epimerase|nr:dTDP-4-dehydrorhamnose 3,5-epimerase [Bacteroidales bacterium]